MVTKVNKTAFQDHRHSMAVTTNLSTYLPIYLPISLFFMLGRMLVVVLNPLCPVRLSLLLYYIYFCFSDPNKTISISISISISTLYITCTRLQQDSLTMALHLCTFVQFHYSHLAQSLLKTRSWTCSKPRQRPDFKQQVTEVSDKILKPAKNVCCHSS